MSGWKNPLRWGVVCVVVVATSVQAQGIKPGTRAKRNDRGRVHQMEIFDGSRRIVRYYGDNISPGESSTLRELERAQNEVAYLNDLQSLKHQYIVSERLLETHRRLVQRDLYGLETTRSAYGTLYSGYYGYGMGGYYGYPYGSTGNYTALSAVAGDSLTETRSLAYGVGPEGRIKEAMSIVLAQQATPEYASKIDRAYDMAVLRATASPTLRVALAMPSTDLAQKEDSMYRRLSGELTPAGTVTLTLKDGEKIYGKKMTEKGEWFVIEKMDGSTEQVRQSEVTRVQRGSSGGVVPASDR